MSVQSLNDLARTTLGNSRKAGVCRVLLTEMVCDLPDPDRAKLLSSVATFDAWTKGDDPHDEHDFGAIDLAGHGRFFFKFDYYAHGMAAGADDPADAANTVRVLTIMHASEY